MALAAVPYPATIELTRSVDDRASVACRGNRYAPGTDRSRPHAGVSVGPCSVLSFEAKGESHHDLDVTG
jgi:hypothetical protein